MELISVIVPIYNVEKYIERCVKSIVSQTYTELQIILVDDGSPDRCPELCDEWAKADNRITVIHKENGGLSDARNAGMRIASGKYIAFVDGDDWIEPEMYEQMHRRMVETNSDIVSCGIAREQDGGHATESLIRVKEEVVLTKQEAMKALIQYTHLVQIVGNKLYCLENAREIPFEVGKIHEDEFWSWKIISRANRVATINADYYHYIQRADSIMGKGYTGKPMLVVEARKERNTYIRNQMPELLDLDSVDLMYTCYYHGCQVLMHKDMVQRKECLNNLFEVCRQCEISKDYLRQLPFGKRLRILYFRLALPLVCWLRVHLIKWRPVE